MNAKPKPPHSLGDCFAFVVADDHPSVAAAVRQMCVAWFRVDGEQLAVAHCSKDLIALCSQPSAFPRIVVLDLVMPGEFKRAGLVRAVLLADPAARVVVFSGDDSPFLANAIMQAGASGYVCKSSPMETLGEAIVAASEGGRFIDPCISMGRLESHPWSTLSDRERSALLALCRGEKPEDTAARTGRSKTTISNQQYAGLEKLGLAGRGRELLQYLYEHGLMCELDEA